MIKYTSHSLIFDGVTNSLTARLQLTLGTGRCGGGHYGGALQKRVDGTAESPDTHITMDATAER